MAISKAKIMGKANELISMLDVCSDGDFVDCVCARVAYNEHFDDDEIEEADA